MATRTDTTEITGAVQDYAKAIWSLARRGRGPVATSALAERLDVSPASASAMIKRLEALGLVSRDPTTAARARASAWRSRCCATTGCSSSTSRRRSACPGTASTRRPRCSSARDLARAVQLIAGQAGQPDPRPARGPDPDPGGRDRRAAVAGARRPRTGRARNLLAGVRLRTRMLRYLSDRGIAPGDEVELVRARAVRRTADRARQRTRARARRPARARYADRGRQSSTPASVGFRPEWRLPTTSRRDRHAPRRTGRSSRARPAHRRRGSLHRGGHAARDDQRDALLAGRLALAHPHGSLVRARRGSGDRARHARFARRQRHRGRAGGPRGALGTRRVVQMWGRPESVREFRRRRELQPPWPAWRSTARTCCSARSCGARAARRRPRGRAAGGGCRAADRRPHGRSPRATERSAGAELPRLGFYSHVEQDVRKSAEEAGFERVVPRSRMAREAPALVESMLAG